MSPSHSEQAPLLKFYRMFGASVVPPHTHTRKDYFIFKTSVPELEPELELEL
jgi:hypothetical protein